MKVSTIGNDADSRNAVLPLLVEYLQKRALREPGLFRLHRPVRLIRILWQKLCREEGGRGARRLIIAEEKDPHVVADLL